MSISQKIDNKELTDENKMYVSNNFKTFGKEEDREVVHFMINTVDDLIQILRDNASKYDEISVAHMDDDLTELFYELKKAGYQPNIHFGAGIINTITCVFKICKKKSITVHIKSQRPSKFKIEETVMVPDVETLNNLHKVRHEFTSSIIRSDYKSFYSEKDMEVFKDFRSRAKYGIFDIKDTRDPDDLVEIDITKAYTAAFEKIDKVPVFSEFDIWKPYNDDDTPTHY